MTNKNLAADHKIDIRPSSSVYATYQRLSYKPWYALAEFVDNSTASYLSHRKMLMAAYRDEQPKHQLKCRVEVNYDHATQRLTITDNAFGMEFEDFRRAIVLDQPPSDRSGRNEFGMGLKTAACWFGTRWTVETTQLGSPHLYRATIDVREVAETRRESIDYTIRKVKLTAHRTTITIENVLQPIIGRAHERVREQLRSIYRSDLRKGEVEIWYQGQKLTYGEPELLQEETANGTKVWRMDISLEVPWEQTGRSLAVTGWVGIRKTMSRRDSGFVLMRRGRVIVGGPEEGYRPSQVFGATHTHEYARIVGELNLDGWPVNQAKDGFSWNNGLEDALIEALEKTCKDVTRKARNYRIDPEPQALSTSDMKAAAEPILQVLQTEPFRQFAKAELVNYPVTTPSPGTSASEPSAQIPAIPVSPALPVDYGFEELEEENEATKVAEDPIEYLLNMGEQRWLLRLHWQESQPEQYWMSLQPPRPAHDNELQGAQVVEITLNMAHPFLAPYLQSRSSLDVLQRLVFGLALAETMVRTQAVGGRVDPGALRMKMNEVLKYAAQAEKEC